MIKLFKQLKLTKMLRALVPQNFSDLNNGLPRCSRENKPFTVHRSQFTHLAFTLAETLIVIGILGVVAALTLPNLNHATGDKEKVTRVKKIYSALVDAIDRAQVIYGPCNEWHKGVEDDSEARNERFAKRITEFMKVSKDCGFDEGCFSQAPRIGYDNGQASSNFLTYLQGQKAYMLLLSDGTAIAFFHSNILVDIDGPNKGKNQNGNDIFDFCMDLTDSNKSDVLPLESGDVPDSYTSFSTWIIKNGNMDYQKADETGEDEWTCRETGIVLDGVTNTSCH